MKINRRYLIPGVVAIIATFTGTCLARRPIFAWHAKGRIVIVMVWDGLRPDLVNQQDTPNLYTLQTKGVRFENHHAIFPTITMVNAAAMATGGNTGESGILGDYLYLAPALDSDKVNSIPSLGSKIDAPINMENSHTLAALNGPNAFNGHLLGLEAIGTQVRRAGGYAAIVGKRGPTFLFDDKDAGGTDAGAKNFLFVADDMGVPEAAANELAKAPPMSHGDLGSISARDAWFTQIVTDQALPAAKRTSAEGRPAVVVLWQHNPDLTQHIAGLGTAPAIAALHQCDANLGRLESAISSLGIADHTDLVVVSDHGFATIRLELSLSDLLVAAGIKKSADSNELVVAPNGGYDLLYLSHQALATAEARRLALVRIADFAEAQEWCGPIFSAAPSAGTKPSGNDAYLGWIPGTFNQNLLGLQDSPRVPDMIISFREIPNSDNHDLTGPENPAFMIGAKGQQATQNFSYKLIRPVEGLIYSDVGPEPHFTTGMGMHGAAGTREIHNYCAAVGPGFRRRFNDQDPTSNVDVAATIRELLRIDQPSGADGRVMNEALAKGGAAGARPTQFTMKTYLPLQGSEVVTQLLFSHFDGHDYLDDSNVSHAALGSAP
jgi:predicted AlkP superfamily pyrophosphatase or phosphodiesterase